MNYDDQFLMRLESQEIKSFKLLIDSFCKKDTYLNQPGFLYWPCVTKKKKEEEEEDGMREWAIEHKTSDWLEIKKNLEYILPFKP